MSKSAITRAFVNSKKNIRSLYWVKEIGQYKYIGLEKVAIDIYEGINKVKFSNTSMILEGDTLFEVDSNTPINGEFKSKTNSYVVSKNQKVMQSLNCIPEDFEKSWIVKIKDVNTDSKSYGKFLRENPNATKQEKRNAIKNFYDQHSYTPYTYNTSPNDYKNKTNKYDSIYHTNSNESDSISYIMSNH